MSFAKAVEAGSALRGAGELHASAHVHAIRYGEQGSPRYKQAYSQHVGRFLSCMREFQRGATDARLGKKFDPDEPRDTGGRWADVKIGKYSAGGLTGLNRDEAIKKIRGALDKTVGPHGVTGFLAGKLASMSLPGQPAELQDMIEQHVAHATGYLVQKVKNDPHVRRLFVSALAKGSRLFRKSLEPPETIALKGHVARIMADTRLHPRIACDDAALAAVAHGVYRHMHDRLQAQVAAL